MLIPRLIHSPVPAALTSALAEAMATPGGGGKPYAAVREYLDMPKQGGVMTDKQAAWDVLRVWVDKARQDDPDNTISKSDIMGEFGKDWTKVKWDAVGKGAATASASKKRKLETEEQEQVEVKQEEQTPMELLKQAGTAIENLKKLLPDMGDNKKVLNENKMLKKKLKEAKEELDSLKKTLASLASGST